MSAVALCHVRPVGSGWAVCPADHPEAVGVVALPPRIEDWAAGARFALEQVVKLDRICWLTDSMREIGIKQAGNAVIAERDRMRAASSPAGVPHA